MIKMSLQNYQRGIFFFLHFNTFFDSFRIFSNLTPEEVEILWIVYYQI